MVPAVLASDGGGMDNACEIPASDDPHPSPAPGRGTAPSGRAAVYLTTQAITATTWLAWLLGSALITEAEHAPGACSGIGFGCTLWGADLAGFLALFTWPVLVVPVAGVALTELVQPLFGPRARRTAQWVVGLVLSLGLTAVAFASLVMTAESF